VSDPKATETAVLGPESVVPRIRLVHPIWRLAKRLIDVVASGLLLILLAPLFAVLAILVKLTSPGPVFYRWKVVGEGGRYFTSHKFRSMFVNADEIKERLLGLNEMKGPVFKMKDDPRITRTGRWMRQYSLDELPQLWSVLKGEMSLVGPRPPLQNEYEKFTEWQKGKLRVKPGITCLWQISGRHEIRDFNEWVRLDLEYIANWSLCLDLKILLRTIRAVISGSGR